MLQLILGRAGSGKTEYIRRELVHRAKAGEEGMLLLVPEQFSFACEKALLLALGERLANRVEVLTFTRLADAVAREYGGFAGASLTDGERALTMSLALEAVQDRLNVYTRNLQNAGTVASMLNLTSELTACSVAPEELGTLGARMPEGTLRRKLSDLSLITGAYEGLLAASHPGAKDTLGWLGGLLAEHPYFAGKTVAVDAFHGFTAQEFNVLGHMLGQAGAVFISLCMDPEGKPDPLSIFAPIRETAERLKRLAHKANVEVKSPVKLMKPRRTFVPELKALEQGLFQPGAAPFEGAAGAVTLYEAASPEEAAGYLACTAKRLMRTQGVRCREMLVIARSISDYQSALQSAFSRYGVPVAEDSRQPVTAQPLMRMLVNAFAVLATGFDTDAMLAYLKTGLTGHTVDEISQLENYVILWSISRSAWLKDWQNHPDGLGSAFTPKQERRLKELNRVRREAVSPLLGLRDACEQADGESIAAAVFRFLQRVGVPGHLSKLADALQKAGQSALALEQGRVWDMLMEMLDQLARALKGRTVTASRFGELLGLLIDTQDLGHIPEGLDNISLGSADRVRPDGPRVVFLLGTNEGEFPAVPREDGILSGAERACLRNEGLELFEGREELALKERFWAYLAAASPAEQLYVVWSAADRGGAAQQPSALVRECRRLLPGRGTLTSLTQDPLNEVEGVAPAFSLMARLWREPSELSSTLRAYFLRKPETHDKVLAVERAARQAPLNFQNPGKAAALFQNDMMVSASRVETYYHCPFQYFLKFGLSAKPRRVAQLDPMQSGTVIHYVLEHLLREFGGRGLSDASPGERGERVRFYLTEYMEKELNVRQELGARFDYLFSRLADTIAAVVEQMAAEFGQSLFEPTAFELDIGPGGEVPPLTVPLPDGGTLSIRGQVDRVDCMQTDTGRYLRVVDYKSGTKKFLLGDVLAGLNMQMLIYLICVCREGAGPYEGAIPAGVLYMPARRSLPTLARDTGEESLRKEHQKDFCMSGMVLGDEGVLRGMERRMEGVFIPAKLTESRGMTGTLISIEQMGRLTEKIERLLAAMGSELLAGKVSPCPASGGNYADTCKWCDYRAVCASQENKPERVVEKLDHAESLKRLEEEEEHGKTAMDEASD